MHLIDVLVNVLMHAWVDALGNALINAWVNTLVNALMDAFGVCVDKCNGQMHW
jgi:hypothetical protein